MGDGLKRVCKQLGGLTAKANGKTVRFDANGKIKGQSVAQKAALKILEAYGLSGNKVLTGDTAAIIIQEAIDAAQAKNVKALKFYAGTKRADGNGYEFQKETFTGETARKALGIEG